jgi:ABC-type microcin C transport system permease subunit YejE
MICVVVIVLVVGIVVSVSIFPLVLCGALLTMGSLGFLYPDFYLSSLLELD